MKKIGEGEEGVKYEAEVASRRAGEICGTESRESDALCNLKDYWLGRPIHMNLVLERFRVKRLAVIQVEMDLELTE